MSETQTISELNDATDASLASRTETKPVPVKRAPRKASPKAAAKPKAPAKAAVPVKSARKARTPSERAALPVTATIASYVEWLNREVYGGKMTGPQKSLAGVSITLYGAYQISPERRAARGA